MTNSLKVFSNDDFTIRTINEDGKIWFVAKDVAQALDYSEESIKSLPNLIANVPEMWTARKRIQTSSDCVQIMNALRSFITTRLSRGLGRTQNFLINLRRLYYAYVLSLA